MAFNCPKRVLFVAQQASHKLFILGKEQHIISPLLILQVLIQGVQCYTNQIPEKNNDKKKIWPGYIYTRHSILFIDVPVLYQSIHLQFTILLTKSPVNRDSIVQRAQLKSNQNKTIWQKGFPILRLIHLETCSCHLGFIYILISRDSF
jgi:hypothetical protein